MGMNIGSSNSRSFTLKGVSRLPSALTPFTAMKASMSTSSLGRSLLRLSKATFTRG